MCLHRLILRRLYTCLPSLGHLKCRTHSPHLRCYAQPDYADKSGNHAKGEIRPQRMPMRKKHQVFAIVRVDEFQGTDTAVEDKVTVKQIVSTQKIVEREVERLTRLNSEKGYRYFWQATRFVEW